MNAFLDLGYRLVATVACVWCGRTVWFGYLERKIRVYNTDWLDWWTPSQVIHREAAPIQYWLFMSIQAFTAVMCFLAIFIGWWPANP